MSDDSAQKSSQKSSQNPLTAPLALALGASLVTFAAGGAYAADNPFGQKELTGGQMLAQMSEGKCGGMRAGKGGYGMKMMDADGDGKITREEFDKGHAAKFDAMDTDGDGKLSRDEFQKRHTDMFGAMDANKDGVIDADEMGKMRNMEGKCGAMMKKSAE